VTASRQASNVQPLFVNLAPGPMGRRFVVHHTPPSALPRALIVYAHPFAEEMNKSRRMAALQSRALAAAGYAVLQIDLLGCGDSEGDFGDATWSGWVDDVVSACAWLRRQHGAEGRPAHAMPLWIWGLRVGCLLATQAALQTRDVAGLLLWQPTVSGKTALQQFLRLKTAAEMLSGQARGSTAELRQRLLGGESVDVAGYTVAPALASGMEAAALQPPVSPTQIIWLEQASGENASLSPASALAVQRWQQSGCTVHTHAVVGPAFWQTTEIEDAPAWIEGTLAALAAIPSDPPATAYGQRPATEPVAT